MLYKVIAGSFRNRDNAEKRVHFLSSKGIDSFIVPTTISSTRYYRVQAGAFSSKENAELQVDKLKRNGISGGFIVEEGEQAPTPVPPKEGISIVGNTSLLAHQLDEFAKTVNPQSPELGEYYIFYGRVYGVRADIAFAQAIHETNYFRFTGLVHEDQNNFAGIGATGPGSSGASFSSPELGVHAHIQHLYAYASKASIPKGYSKVDPRFALVSRGSALHWTQLNGKWAVPGADYGEKILSVYKRNVTHAIRQMKDIIKSLENVLHDL
ncbi:SPOR domain-containing protein [Halobacillus salinarum]|uniref:SPOR domain-containing protein n=1 Tax=Halobacillus salinarum TaxID=2932257 RepID=A0ABY4EHH0_9BACI|nr:SPOR domain-containing protein [Halobacillus salinarum]UOQ43338.1 SPOR domain-containing protein [Halobacillus salinarum]